MFTLTSVVQGGGGETDFFPHLKEKVFLKEEWSMEVKFRALDHRVLIVAFVSPLYISRVMGS